MLAWHSPIRAIAIHVKVSPRRRKHFQPCFLGNIEYRWRQVHVEQLRHNGRLSQDAINQSLFFRLRKLVDNHGYGIGSHSATLHLSLNLVAIEDNTLYRPIASIASTTRNAIGIIYM